MSYIGWTHENIQIGINFVWLKSVFFLEKVEGTTARTYNKVVFQQSYVDMFDEE